MHCMLREVLCRPVILLYTQQHAVSTWINSAAAAAELAKLVATFDASFILADLWLITCSTMSGSATRSKCSTSLQGTQAFHYP